jgi:hypothetical protein
MERMLLKIARQLDALDESSLMALWEKYATVTARFEPTRRWEEAALVFSFIQAKRWKNQLFNHHWAQQTRPAPEARTEGEEGGGRAGRRNPVLSLEPSDAGAGVRKKRGQVLRFRPGKRD